MRERECVRAYTDVLMHACAPLLRIPVCLCRLSVCVRVCARVSLHLSPVTAAHLDLRRRLCGDVLRARLPRKLSARAPQKQALVPTAAHRDSVAYDDRERLARRRRVVRRTAASSAAATSASSSASSAAQRWPW